MIETGTAGRHCGYTNSNLSNEKMTNSFGRNQLKSLRWLFAQVCTTGKEDLIQTTNNMLLVFPNKVWE